MRRPRGARGGALRSPVRLPSHPASRRFTVARSDHVLALFVYLGVAIATAQLVCRVRERTEIADREQRRTALLYELNAALIGDVTLDCDPNAIVAQVVTVYGAARCRILLPEADWRPGGPGPLPSGTTGAMIASDWRRGVGDGAPGARRQEYGGPARALAARVGNRRLAARHARREMCSTSRRDRRPRGVGVLEVTGRPGGRSLPGRGRADADDLRRSGGAGSGARSAEPRRRRRRPRWRNRTS